MKNRNAAVKHGGIFTVFRGCLYRLSHLVILGEWFGNTGLEALAMGERWGRCGCKDCLYTVKGLWAMGVRS